MISTEPNKSGQEAVFAFLGDPVRHPGVIRIDTHAASVFLDGDRVLKIKRAVRFPFLDYSTLAKRKAACDEEIRINTPFAPEIYRRVVPITRAEDGSLSIDGPGEPVEFAVEMARFDENRTADHLAARDALDDGFATRLAEAVAASHATARPLAAGPWIASIPGIIDGYIAALEASARFPAGEIAALAAASRARLTHLQPLLDGRGSRGCVRRCHGDLHLANVVMIGSKPVLFDAIEFDERIASIDVFYDLAFPLMDLLRHDQRTAANQLLNRYLAVTAADQIDGVACLPLFMSMRAAIRAQVLLARLDRPDRDGSEDAAAAALYFRLAQRLIDPPPPTLIAIGGLSGTGKSVLARALAPLAMPEPGAILLRSDALRKELFGVGETDRLPPEAYTPAVNTRVYATLAERAARVLAQGHSAVVDAVFAREAERTEIAATARTTGAGFQGVFLVADLDTRRRRVGSRQADASDATPEIAGLQESYDLGAIDWTRIDASGTPDVTLARCRAGLAGLVGPAASRPDAG